MPATQPISLTNAGATAGPDADVVRTDLSLVLKCEPSPAIRKHLPDERRALTHHFSIAGQEGYLTVVVYEDGLPGEIFITMAEQGSTISGLMDSFATADLVSVVGGDGDWRPGCSVF
jgi:ribonucleoside-diphosphate reductase alpha chain